MKKQFFLFLISVFLFFPTASFALTQIDVEGNAVEWANATNEETLGTTLASGDVNGDGIDDILIGNPQYDSGAANRGRVYLVYGSENVSSSPFTNDTLNSAVTFTGVNASDIAGTSLALVDINKDGFDDIFIGAPGYIPYGITYLIYGQDSPLSSISLSHTSVREFEGQESGTDLFGGGEIILPHPVGQKIISAGDINGDTYEDIAISATRHSETFPLAGSLGGSGAVYIIYGQDSQFGDSGSFNSFDVKLNGVTNLDQTGNSLAGGGDIDNDGFDDLIIGADQGPNSGAGRAYIIYGQNFTSGTTINLSTRPTLTGEVSSDAAGSAITLSNLNNDAYADIIVGASLNDDGLSNAGSVYVIYGSGTRVSGTHNLSEYVQITGARISGNMGSALAGGQDLNNDGIEDLVVGTPAASTSIGGQAHILFGSSSQETSGSISDKADILLNSLVGNHQNAFGKSFALGDFNGDGSPQFSDIAIGAPTTGPNKGAVYTFFQRFDNDDDGYDSPDADHVLFSGTDCDETNIAIYTNYTFHQDEDNDNSGTGATQVLCQGASPSAPSGHRLSVINTTDCNDNDATVSANQTYYQDQDSDTIGSGATESICSATPSSGYRVSVTGSTDCNDTDATVSANQTYYLDADADTIGNGTTTETICSMTPSSGYRTSVTGNNDCNDSEAAISRNQTYYRDEDADGLGSDETLTECSLTAPSGYVTNSNDTDDTIANNGVEISGDGIDNDSDGSVDEDNTVSTNGAHPGYKNLSVTSADDYKNAVRSVTALTNGKVRITFKDGSAYIYTIFNEKTTKKTLIKNIQSTGRILAVSSNGKSFKLVNAFSGNTFSTVSGIKSKKSYKTHNLLIKDIRSDGSLEALLVSKDKGKTASVVMVRISQKNTLKTQARKEISGLLIDVKKTKLKTASIELRNTKRKVLHVLSVTKLYEFKNPK